MTLMTLVLSNNNVTKIFSLLKNLFAQNQIEYYNCESINVMQLQMVNGFNRINIVCNVDLNYDKENVSLLRGIPHIFNTTRDKSRSVT